MRFHTDQKIKSMKINIYTKFLLFFISLFSFSCKNLDTVNNNNPSLDALLSSGDDLVTVLHGGYIAWWQGVHSEKTVIPISVAADAYGMSWDDYGSKRMGEEPRLAYNNRDFETQDYKQIAAYPWFNCHSAVSSANDILNALEKGITIDNNGPQDEGLRAAAHLLRGLSWGYLGLMFDQAFLVDENADLTQTPTFSTYTEMVAAAILELEEAISIAEAQGIDFEHEYFNGLSLNAIAFVKLCHAYAARFLSQWPRTATENIQVNWQAVADHAEKGLDFDFAPIADGNSWQSYHQFAFAETGKGPFWARVDQRLVAALDPSQPTRYPEVVNMGETPLANPVAQSNDKRLETDFIFETINNFPAERGEWHYSHYKHNRNQSDPDFAGDGASSGPMPVFLAADNALLHAEALLRLGREGDAVIIINSWTRVNRGQLSALPNQADANTIEQAIMYERAIELLSTGPMNLWFDRRRIGPRLNYLEVDDLGGLQMRTPAHLPVPAGELKIQGLEPYNYGGEEDPEGIVPVF